MSISTCVLVGIFGYMLGAGSIIGLGLHLMKKEKEPKK